MFSSEKLDLDRRSVDISIEEEDALESKQVVPKDSSEEGVDRTVKTAVPVVGEEAPADDMQGDISVDNSHDENKKAPTAPILKRTLHGKLVPFFHYWILCPM